MNCESAIEQFQFCGSCFFILFSSSIEINLFVLAATRTDNSIGGWMRNSFKDQLVFVNTVRFKVEILRSQSCPLKLRIIS